MPANRTKRPTGVILHPDDILIILDTQGRLTEWNETAEKVLGWSKNEVIGLPWAVLFPQSGLNPESVLKGRDFAGGFTARRKDGTSIALYFYARLLKDKKRQIEGILCLGRDVTQFWQPAEKTAESEIKLQTLLETSLDPVLIISTRGVIMEANPATTKITGISAENLIGQPLTNFLPLENQSSLTLFARRVLKDGSGRTTLEILTPRGEKLLLDVNARVLTTACEIKIMAVCRDITDWEHKKRALKNTAQLLEALINIQNSGVCITTLDGTLLKVNPALTRLLGLEEKNILGEKLWDILPQEITATLPQLRATLLEKGAFQLELVIRRQDGNKLWIHLNSHLLTLPEEPLILILISDRTAEKLALQEVKESETRLKLLLDQVPGIIWTTDLQLNLHSVIGSRSPELAREIADAAGKNVTDILKLNPELEQTYHRVLSGEPAQFEYEKRDRIYHLRLEPLRGLDGEITGTIGLAYDITELRNAEKRTRELLRWYETLIDISPVVIAIHQDNRIVMINRTGIKMLGYAHASELIGRSVTEFVHPDDWPIAVKRIRNALEKGISNPPIQERLRKKDGSYILVQVRNSPVTWNNRPAILVIAEDLSEKEKLSKKVQEILTHTKAILENSPIGIVAELDGIIVYTNPFFAQIFGYEVSEIIGKPVISLVAPHERERIHKYTLARLQGEPAPDHYEFEGVTKNHTVKRFSVKVTTYRIDEQLYILGFIREK